MNKKKILIIRPKYGLCNQLKSISKGIIFAIISKRDIFFDKFQLDFRDENNSCNFNDIIDTNSNNDDNTFVKTVAVGWTVEQHRQPMLNINGKY